MITRRTILKGASGLALGAMGLASYAFAIEPGFMLEVTRYRLQPVDWPRDLSVKIVILADIHACEPYMGPARIGKIARLANSLQPDLFALLGDFNGGHRFVTGPVLPEQWAEALTVLKAPLGVHAVLGNHDWWHGPLPGTWAQEAEPIRVALKAMGAQLYENDALRLEKDGRAFWLAGLADQMARKSGRHTFRGLDDLAGTLNKVKDEAPVVLMAHEPFVFPRVPDRVSVTLCGHTHGGQVNLPFFGPVVAESRMAPELIYGHHQDGARHLIVSAGLGESIVPVRFMRPPELVEVTIEGAATA